MVTQTYNLNMIPNGQIINVHVSQYDTGREIVFNLYNGSAKFTPATGTTATIEGTKPDNKGFSLTATISGSTASFTTTKNMCAVPGDTICEFRLMKNSQNVGTANFILKVERAGLADDVDTSETELPAYEAAAQQAAQDAAASAAAAAGSATTAGNAATTAAESASSANTYALKSEGYAVGKQNGTDVGSTSPYYHNNAEYFAQQAAASVAEGTQVAFYMQNGHLYVQQTIQGVQQPAQDLGEVGGAGALSGLSDVALSSLTNGQVLVYDSATGKWKNGDVGGGSKEKENVKTYYTSAASGITVSAAYSRVYGNITILEVALNIASGTTINQGNNTVVTLNNYTQHKDLVPYDHGIAMQSYFTASYLPVDAPCEITATLLYNGGIDITMQSGGHTFDSAYTLELCVVFINNRSVSSFGGGSPVTQETYVNIASNISVIGDHPISIYYAWMHRRGRDTWLEICMKTTGEWTYSDSAFGLLRITDSDGKLTPFWLDSQHQSYFYCGDASFDGARQFLARMFYWDATHVQIAVAPNSGQTVATNAVLYMSLHFTSKYDE